MAASSQDEMEQILRKQQKRRSSQYSSQLQQEQPPIPRISNRTDTQHRTHGPTFSLKSVDDQYVLLLDSIDKLKMSSDFDLPEIVVVGDQSEGKSTVLEAIAGVKLPKGDKTCTKCLIRLCIRRGTNVHTTIEFDGKSTDVKDQADFSKTLKSIMDESFPDQISMKAVIDVKIVGPSRPNLTVVDAPGFKSNSSESGENDDNMQALRERLDDSNVVMVVVLKAINDIEASRGFGLAKGLDPSFRRTVFVLTHCDNLVENKQTMVSDMLKDQNAYAVNCYTDKKEFSSDEEKRFFEGQSFWRGQPQSNLGVEALIGHLAENMFRILEPRKDEIHKRLLNMWLAEDEELQKLKEEHVHADREFRRLIQKVNKDLEEYLTGSHRTEKNELFSDCKKLWLEFENDLKNLTDEVRSGLKEIVLEECDGQIGRELHSLPNYFPVLERIIEKHIIDAVEPTISKLISNVECIIQSHIESKVKLRLKDREPLENFVNTKIREHLPTLRRDVADKIKMIMSMEKAFYQSIKEVDQNSAPPAAEPSGTPNEEPELTETLVREGANLVLPSSVKGAVETLWNAFGQDSGEAEAVSTDPTEKSKKTLFIECYEYIGFVQHRIANNVPKAMIQFMLKRMAEDIWDCVSEDQLDEDTRNQLKAEVDERIAYLDKSTADLQNLLAKF